jgi:hypothetical protein
LTAVNQEKLRNGVIMIYMVGNALTFTEVMSQEGNGYGTAGFASQVMKALAVSLLWPVYWIWRILFV